VKRRRAAPRRRRSGRVRAERRRGTAGLGAHPERRVLAPLRRVALRPRTAGSRRSAVVLPPVVNMFERPDASSPVVSQATLGTLVGVLDAERGYDLVETPDLYRGWIRSAALRWQAPRAVPHPPPGVAWRVRNFMGQIYPGRDVTAASPIAVAPLLAIVEVIEDRPEWKRVRLPDGRRGWMQDGDLEPVRRPRAPVPLDGVAVAATALRFLGLPYLWGGTTPFGLDCSGLAQLVYRVHGHMLPRDADQQHAHAALRAVDRADLCPGDLVFFGPDPTSITHVGIMLDGETFVSATTYRTPTVRVDQMDDPYWARLYRSARRLRTRG
jgi:gamma-D-glutamyl-L-lysine dipeptidyl-peptidase